MRTCTVTNDKRQTVVAVLHVPADDGYRDTQARLTFYEREHEDVQLDACSVSVFLSRDVDAEFDLNPSDDVVLDPVACSVLRNWVVHECSRLCYTYAEWKPDELDLYVEATAVTERG